MPPITSVRRLGITTLAALLAAVSIFGTASLAMGAENTKEYQIKAAFLFNFVKFTSWPSNVLRAKEPFHLCILGYDPFGSILETMGERSVKERPVRIRRFENLTKLDGCHLLFIGLEVASVGDNTLTDVARSGLLIVGDSPGLASRGAAINLFTEAKKVRFEVNIEFRAAC